MWSINPRHRKHSDRYVQAPSSTQEKKKKKIRMVTESWERLITNKHAQTTTSLSLILHRITGRKEATTLLHRLGVGIFYNDVRLITSYWDSCIILH